MFNLLQNKIKRQNKNANKEKQQENTKKYNKKNKKTWNTLCVDQLLQSFLTNLAQEGMIFP